jgi:HK97 family phage major capsid protein
VTATKLTVPSGPDGLLELLGDHGRLKDYFSQEAVADGTTKDFLDSYAKLYAAKHPDEMGNVRDQVQSVMFDMIREAGGGRKPMMDLGNAISFTGGRPQLNLSPDGTPAVSKGKGVVYNKFSPGAAFENAYRADDRFGTIGEYCQAIREEARPTSAANRKDLLQKLENARSFQNSFGSEDPGAGGFLIPEIMRSELLQLALEDSIVRSRATVIPMSTLRVPIPALDDTTHASSLFGGVIFYWAEESAALTESQATFGRVVLDAKKLTGYFKVPNELLADAPAFSGWFDSRVPAGLAWWEDVAFLNESGAGTPLGCIGAQNPAYVTVDRATSSELNWADIVSMYARMLPTSLKSAVWVCSIDVFPLLAQISLSSPGIWMGGWNAPNASEAPPITIMGRPVIFTEKVGPSLTVGDISFVDFGYYLIGDRQAVAVAASDQVAFQNDQTAYRIIERVDGRPWVQSALTPHNGSSATLSPYVGLSATHT